MRGYSGGLEVYDEPASYLVIPGGAGGTHSVISSLKICFRREMPGKAVSHHTGKSPDGTVVSFLIPRIRLVTDIRLGITVETPAFKENIGEKNMGQEIVGIEVSI